MKLKWWQTGLLISLVVALFSPLASASPDGLERVAEDHGFLNLSSSAPFKIIADYLFPGIANEALGTILAGLIGTLTLFGMVYGIAWLLKSGKKETATTK